MKAIRKTGVYTITNLINGKMIVGSGILEDRKYDHFNRLERNKHGNPHLQDAVNKYGIENFVFEVIEECEHEVCFINETWWIYFLDTKNKEKGYNINDPIKGRLGVKNTIEHNEKIRLYRLGKTLSEETKDKIIKSCKKHIPKGKAIIQLDLNGNFIKEWNSISLAARYFKLFHGNISACCKHKKDRKSLGGFKWEYKENYDKNIK